MVVSKNTIGFYDETKLVPRVRKPRNVKVEDLIKLRTPFYCILFRNLIMQLAQIHHVGNKKIRYTLLTGPNAGCSREAYCFANTVKIYNPSNVCLAYAEVERSEKQRNEQAALKDSEERATK